MEERVERETKASRAFALVAAPVLLALVALPWWSDSGWMRRIAAIDHVKIVRLHTRLPVVSPEKITLSLVRALKVPGATTYVALHANHPRELTPAVRAACARFVDAGIPMLSQSVLLRGVNDDAETLGALMRVLVECRIKPYYLHHADLAPGTAHWRTTIGHGQSLMRALHGHYSGLCQPAYVLDIPGGQGKSPIGPSYLSADGCTIEDFNGRRHTYPPQSDGEKNHSAAAAGKTTVVSN